jgi:uncharacterized protein YuzE
MNICLGEHQFDDLLYDPEGDVLYMSKGRPAPAAKTIASPEGHAIRLDASHEIIGITLVGARWLAEQDGRIVITIPESANSTSPLETPASQLAEALAA